MSLDAVNQGASGAMAAARIQGLPVVTIENNDAPGPFLIVCEHASNHIPTAFGTLGLPPRRGPRISPGILARSGSPAGSPPI